MAEKTIESVIAILKDCLPPAEQKIVLHEPLFGGNEWKYTKECLDTGWVSSVGKFVDLFEVELAKYTGAKRAIAVANGTAALHLALMLAGVKRDDEVLIQDLTFVATANAVSYIGAVPHFVDVDENTLSVDAHKLADYLKRTVEKKVGGPVNRSTGRNLRHLVVMHTFGHPADLDELLNVCQHYGIDLIEDAAESLGSFYKGKHTGNFGRIAALSFNGNKIVTTGGGGALLVNDDELGVRAKHISTTAKKPHPYRFDHDEVGYNYRMPNINAALGCAQLEQIASFLDRKRTLAMKYKEAFKDIDGLRFLTEPPNSRSNYWLNCLILDEDNSALLQNLLEATNEAGYGTRPAWTLMHKLPMYEHYPRADVKTSESLESRIINIPSSPALIANPVLIH